MIGTPPVYVDFLNRFDIEACALSDDEILAAVEGGLRMQGQGETAIEPRVHLEPRGGAEGHFNVLRGWIGGAVDQAGVKVVGDFVENWREGRPSEYGLLALFDPATGAPRALLDATGITEMRTGAVTAIGARHLARPGAKVLGHVGARGTAYWNVRLLDRLFGFDEIRVHSRRRREPRGLRRAARARPRTSPCAPWTTGAPASRAPTSWSRPRGSRRPSPSSGPNGLRSGALVVPYGTMSAVELSLTDIMDKVVVDDWGQCRAGRFGALRAHVEAGRLTEATLHAELGQIVAGLRPGRASARDETILLWHRGLSLSDVAMGDALLAKARALGLGQRLRFH